MPSKVNVKRAPAQKSMHNTKATEEAVNAENADFAGPTAFPASEASTDAELALSGNAPDTDDNTGLNDADADTTYLKEDMAEDTKTVRQSGKSAKKASPAIKAAPVDPHLGFNVVIAEGKALKLNPKTNNHVFFEVGIKTEDNTLHVRMSGNEGGGLHSKEWLPLLLICELIEKHQGQSFKSTIFNPLFKGSSANNAGFLGAVLRSAKLGLLKASDVALYQHQVPEDYATRKSTLMAFLDQ